jgi:hypothetical protein
MLPAVVQVKAPVGIKVIVPPVAEIGAGAVIVSIAAAPEIIVTGAVGATVAAEAIVVATAVLAIKPETSDVALATPKTGVTITILVLVQAEILPLVTVPNTGVTITMLVLVQAEILPLVTVPNTGAVMVGVVNVGVVNVGLVANTKAPLPVSPVTAVAKLADEGVAKKAATLAPNPLIPVATGKPVQLVNVPDAGVPRVGVTKALLVNKAVIESCLVVLVVACTIGNTSAAACETATGNEEIAMVVIIDP